MKEREIARMQIENDQVRIVETDASETSARSLAFYSNFHSIVLQYTDDLTVTEWFASIAEKDIAHARLTATGKAEVALSATVLTDYRGFGLGKLMIRLATDLAIRYRKREITTSVSRTSEAAMSILELEEFEPDPAELSDGVTMRKKLNWQ